MGLLGKPTILGNPHIYSLILILVSGSFLCEILWNDEKVEKDVRCQSQAADFPDLPSWSCE